MERITKEMERGHLLVRNLDTSRIALGIFDGGHG
jgi:hypothetical protein